MTFKLFNTPPYYDDFDETKNYVRILFRPGNAVQARELTQMQTSLQAQIDRHGKHVFKEGSPVIGGKPTIDESDFIKVESSFIPSSGGATLVTDNYYEEFLGTTILGQTSGVTAKVIDVVPSGTDGPITLYLKYTNSGTDTETKLFQTEEELVSDAIIPRQAKIKTSVEIPTGKGLRFSIPEGVFFVNGHFVYVPSESLIVSRYSLDISTRIVYEIVENTVTIAEDASLGDNALGTPNEAAPGAHRYQILLNLKTQPFSFTEPRDDKFIQLMLIENGFIKQRATTEYSELSNELARRTYEESGNYVVKPFIINTRELYNDGSNNGLYNLAQLRRFSRLGVASTDAQVISYGESRLAVGLEKSVAYVNGYRIELEDIKYVELLKSRETEWFNGASIVANLGNYVTVNVSQGLPDVDTFGILNLKDSGNSVIGTARARSIDWVSGTTYKLYLFDISMAIETFSDVVYIQQTLSSGPQFTATLVSTNLFDTNYNSLVYKLPFDTVQTLIFGGQNDTYYTVKRKTSASVTGSQTTVDATDGVIQPYNSTDWIAIDNSGDPINISGVTISFNSSTNVSSAVISFSDHTTGDVYIVYPIDKNLAKKTKNLIEDHVILKTSPNTTPGSYDSLGITDVFRLVSIKDVGVPLAGGGFLDITDRYELDNGQRDNFYGIGRVRLKFDAIPPIGNLSITLDYFLHGTGDYFSVDSYSGIDYEDIPSFNSIKGQVELRDAIDFRPVKTTSGDNFTGAGSSLVDIVKPGSIIRTDIVYYLNRIDKIYVDKDGNFGILQGVPALNPEPPKDLKDSMILYRLEVGAFTFGPESINPIMIDNRRYTMRDIGKLERRIKNLEYYTTLSLLEKETADYQLPGNAFKNGFVVDNFYGHNVGNPSNPDYSCSVDRARGVLRPQFVEQETRLKWNSGLSTGVKKSGSLLTLDYSEVSYIEQPYASYAEWVNPYNVFTWTGDMVLSPESDNWKDTETRPDVIIDQEGVYDSFVQLADASGVTGTVWNEWQTNWSGVVASSTSRSNINMGVRDTTITTTKSNQSRAGIRTDVVPDTITTDLGDRVVEVNFVPFIRSRIVAFKAERMKPGTKLYAFFDGKDITAYTTQTTQFFTFSDFTGNNPEYTSGYTFNNRTGWPTELQSKTDLVTDSSGSITGFFIVPNNSLLKFKTGQRTFKLTDEENNIFIDSTTSAEALYEAAGLIESKENVILSTRVPRLDRTMLGEDRVLTSTTSTSRDIITWSDPLAQTIIIDEPGGIFATSLDLYFREYDEDIPVTVHLVTTETGIPTQTIIPFTKVTKKLSAANVSEDASVATNFAFEAPVHLQPGIEYAIVIMSMSDKPKAWVAEMGGFDVTNPTYRISKQPYNGVFFKSANASTWTPEQEKDLKFKLNRAEFTTTSGEIILENVELQRTILGTDPIYTTTGSNVVKVYHKNHGMFVNSDTTIDNITATATTFLNGIPLSELEDTHNIIRVEKEYYEITVTTNATATGRAGGSSLTATANRLMDLMQVYLEELAIPGTSLLWDASVMSAKSFAGIEQEYVASPYFPIIINENTIFNRPQCIPSLENEPAGVRGFRAKGAISTNTSKLSPVLDLDRMSVFSISNKLDHPSNIVEDNRNYVENFVAETEASGTSSAAKYITRRISLTESANNIKVLAGMNRPSGTDLELYYKVQSSEDTNFDFVGWTLATPTSPIPFGENSNNYSEIEYDISTNEFSNMAFKIVLKSRNSSFVPTVRDFRAIAFTS